MSSSESSVETDSSGDNSVPWLYGLDSASDGSMEVSLSDITRFSEESEEEEVRSLYITLHNLSLYLIYRNYLYPMQDMMMWNEEEGDEPQFWLSEAQLAAAVHEVHQYAASGHLRHVDIIEHMELVAMEMGMGVGG
jgi:hypothetical protein